MYVFQTQKYFCSLYFSLYTTQAFHDPYDFMLAEFTHGVDAWILLIG